MGSKRQERQKIWLCNNCNGPANCTTSRRARNDNQRRWTRAAVFSPNNYVLSSIAIYALGCLITISWIAMGSSTPNVLMNQLKVTVSYRWLIQEDAVQITLQTSPMRVSRPVA
ncbi:hypothetical protein PIB30_101434 [Stylosanthes scabra]|uniref:Uncharacterized protein n=1 Tax=Stylosanthes scabra TaxID=79078 RepID=A0ABU6ZW05_9FABA|nr:hypothetical protein [Stylosanthes scabra]